MDESRRRAILSAYRKRSNLADVAEYCLRRGRERILGVDLSIFDKTIEFYAEVYGQQITRREALSRALDKAQLKDAWFRSPRDSVESKMRFYEEIHHYPFVQPYIYRLGGYRWYGNMVKHLNCPSILEYGCGSAVLTEYLVGKFPHATFTVADIPSVTLEFVKWKKQKLGLPYIVLTIGSGSAGIPLVDLYDLIICEDVLEHTPNPLEIVQAFARHLNPGGVLVVNFLVGRGGYNLLEAADQRDSVKEFLAESLVPLKAIDVPHGNEGLYAKDTD